MLLPVSFRGYRMDGPSKCDRRQLKRSTSPLSVCRPSASMALRRSFPRPRSVRSPKQRDKTESIRRPSLEGETSRSTASPSPRQRPTVSRPPQPTPPPPPRPGPSTASSPRPGSWPRSSRQSSSFRGLRFPRFSSMGSRTRWPSMASISARSSSSPATIAAPWSRPSENWAMKAWGPPRWSAAARTSAWAHSAPIIAT